MSDFDKPMDFGQEDALRAVGVEPRPGMSYAEAEELIRKHGGRKTERKRRKRGNQKGEGGSCIVWGGGSFLLGLAVVALVLTFVSPEEGGVDDGTEREERVDTTKRDIRVGVRMWCRYHLRDADFEIGRWGKYVETEDGGYVAYAEVVARNGFGVRMRKLMVFYLDGDFQVVRAVEE